MAPGSALGSATKEMQIITRTLTPGRAGVYLQPIAINVAILMFVTTSAHAQNDRIRLWSGSESGEITKTTPLEVTIERGSATKTIPVSEIRSIVFAGEPAELTQARVNSDNGAFKTGLEALAKIDLAQVKRDLVRQDIEFYKAYIAAKQALLGERPIAEAGREMYAFVSGAKDSFHFLQATELLGDLLVASGKYSDAQKQYDALATTPWPSYKMRAAVLTGRALQAEKKHAEALQQFNAALSLKDESDEGKRQALAAQLSKSVSLSATGKVDEGVQIVEQVIAAADPEDKELNARAYNALGNCYEQAGQTKPALFAYLHTDLLYSGVPEAHAEALARLAELWEKAGQPTQARQARETLQERYASTRWAGS
jgi:tetratricopeptide (TPR) repeat protein